MTQPAPPLDMFKVEAIIHELKASTKPDVIEEMVAAAMAGGVLPRARRQQAVEALSAREGRGSTGLGMGIAIPHAKLEGLRRHAGVVARSSEGVEFRAVDGEPVHVLVMLISPESRPEEHLSLLRWVSTLSRDPDFISFIRQARTGQDIYEVLQERAD